MKNASGYCERCDEPVLAVKNTHRIRNAITTIGFLGIGAKVEPYLCPNCGGPAKVLPGNPLNRRSIIKKERRKAAKQGREPAGWARP
jgi:hypothetical protein